MSLIANIGNTPLIELDIIKTVAPKTRLFAKLESSNPGGSLKDRPVANMLIEAKKNGSLKPGQRLLDSSSGNAGIAYAMLGAAMDIPVSIIVPGNASKERLNRIRAHGAELIITDPIKGYDFALTQAKRLAHEQEDKYWYCDQYGNDNNWLAHYHGTAEEILNELKTTYSLRPDAFVAGIGTGGTITGVGRKFKETHANLHIATVIPDVFPGIEGLKPLGSPNYIVPKILDESVIDQQIPTTLENALPVCEQLAKQGLFVGPSSGAYVYAAMELAKQHAFDVIVTLLCDTGERYFSTGMWDARQ